MATSTTTTTTADVPVNLEEENVPQQPKKKRSKIFIIILIALVIAGAWFGISKYTYSLHHEDTDDAQIEANIATVISKVSGYVSKVYVDDNDHVNKGDTLLTLDDRDLRMALAQAEAALATAKANYDAARANTTAARQNINTSKAAVNAADAQIEAAKINVRRATQDYERYANLIKDHSITQQQFEQAQAAKDLAERQLQVLIDQRSQAAAQTGVVSSQSSASAEQIGVAASMIKQREVDVENAKLNLSYAIITAPESGIVSKVPLQEGQLIQAGQSLFNVVLNNDKWVVANFKETQYTKMQVGQKVSVYADAFPKHEFEARVSSFSPATGAKFSLLPPDNATGNFVKVVQRLPVKIEFTDQNDSLLQRLRAGMNVTVDVHLD